MPSKIHVVIKISVKSLMVSTKHSEYTILL